ncbi:hypothetical protein [Amycolatopsis stemonae]
MQETFRRTRATAMATYLRHDGRFPAFGVNALEVVDGWWPR